MQKITKKISVVLFAVTFVFATITKDFNQTESDWTQRVFAANPSSQEVNLILNLLYFSWMRSMVTVKTQETFIEYLEIVLRIGYDLTNRRMNPSRKQKHPKSQKKLVTNNEKFHNQLHKYKKYSTMYAHCLNTILDEHMLSEPIEHLILELRENARDRIINDAIRQVNFKNAHKALKKLLTKGITGLTEKNTKRGAISDFFLELFPPLAVASFVEFDNAYNKMNKKWGEVLITGSELSNILWKMIENARANMYRSYYNAFYDTVKKTNTMFEAFELFDEHGAIKIGMAKKPLPELID